jgi:hypothetical protein
MNRIRLALLIFPILLTSCAHRVPTNTVEVIDTSLSITPSAESAALDAARDQISRMGRGDSLMLIPITGDAESDDGGRILRLLAPTTREPYDADLQRFREEAQRKFTTWVATVRADPCRSDILGAIDVAAQQLGALPKKGAWRLIVVTDFVEDDARFRFATDPNLSRPARGEALARRLQSEHALDLKGATVCLGRMESSDFGALAPERREAITEFWQAYVSTGSPTVTVQSDGLGLLQDPAGCEINTGDGH